MSDLIIFGNTYTIIATKERMTVPDCFVLNSNKIGTAKGEAKYYIGQDNEEIREFFGDKGFKLNCFLLKNDLKLYLQECKSEYLYPEQNYRKKDDFPNLFYERLKKVNSLDDKVYFEINEETQISGPRIYIKSKSPVYTLIRELSLPKITYMSAIKLLNQKDELEFYFRLFVDFFGSTEHPSEVLEEENKINNKDDLNVDEKKNLVNARIGQGKYRKALLGQCPFCPITLVADDRLLIASHIKPWVQSDEKEKMDPKNGFMFTPTYDYMFDRGFISFTNEKKLIISPWISKMTCSRLNISPDKKYPMLQIEGREKYLEYHRNNILKS